MTAWLRDHVRDPTITRQQERLWFLPTAEERINARRWLEMQGPAARRLLRRERKLEEGESAEPPHID